MFKKPRVMLKAKAHQKVVMVNAGTIQATRRTIKVSTTKVNSPKVRMFKGSERNKATGLITAFTTPRTSATTNAATKPSISTPGNI